MELRPATFDDAALLSCLTTPIQEMHAVAEPEVFIMPAGDDFAVTFWREMLPLEGHYAYIAEENGEALGYIFLREYHGTAHAFNKARFFIEVDQIAVLPDQNGKGVGRALMEKAEEIAKELGAVRIILGVWAFNEFAHDFYEHLGYQDFQQRMWKEV